MKTLYTFFLSILIIFSLLAPIDARGLDRYGNSSDIHLVESVVNVSESVANVTEINATSSKQPPYSPAPPDPSSSGLYSPASISPPDASVSRIIQPKLHYFLT